MSNYQASGKNDHKKGSKESLENIFSFGKWLQEDVLMTINVTLWKNKLRLLVTTLNIINIIFYCLIEKTQQMQSIAFD